MGKLLLGKLLLGKLVTGEVSVGEISSWGNCCWESCDWGNCAGEVALRKRLNTFHQLHPKLDQPIFPEYLIV